MDIVLWLVALLLLYIIVQIIRFIYADADLTLLWYCKFGRSKASLAGQVIWITGASSGIGENLAYILSKFGCRLVLSARSEQKLLQVKKLCQTYGRLRDNEILVLPLDLLDFNSHQTAAQTVIQHFKKIDVLVNNAGRSQKGLAKKTSLQVDMDLLAINFLGTISLTKAVIPYMSRAKEGQILVTSSIAGKIGTPLQAIYSASKYAIQGWFDALRIEVASDNIHITLAVPGPVFSNIRKSAFSEQPGMLVNEDIPASEHRMSPERCAELMAVAVANRLNEVWISPQPVLLFCYIAQYCPTLLHWLAPILGMKAIHTMRYGTNALQQATFPANA